MKKLDDLVGDAVAKGFSESEVKMVRRVWYDACVVYERTTPRPLPGIEGAIRYMDDKFMSAYTQTSRYIQSVVDGWHKDQADGTQRSLFEDR